MAVESNPTPEQEAAEERIINRAARKIDDLLLDYASMPRWRQQRTALALCDLVEELQAIEAEARNR